MRRPPSHRTKRTNLNHEQLERLGQRIDQPGGEQAFYDYIQHATMTVLQDMHEAHLPDKTTIERMRTMSIYLEHAEEYELRCLLVSALAMLVESPPPPPAPRPLWRRLTDAIRNRP